MRTVYADALISSVPTGSLVILAIVFALSAITLFALAVEAGTYPRFRARLRHALRQLDHSRPPSGPATAAEPRGATG